jgi:alpha-glucosidase (family GH31 glycosyl hydrolase)
VTGEPIVRTIEYVFPNQGFGGEKGEFMLGDRYLVAPVLTKDGVKTVTLPRGRWRDDEGRVVKGPCKIVVRVALGRLPVYERMD